MKPNEDINIQHPEAWELLVSITDKQVDYILYTPSVANSLIVGDVARVDDTLQALEDAVYDTPILLNEYKRVRIMVHSQHFVLFPAETSAVTVRDVLYNFMMGAVTVTVLWQTIASALHAADV